MLSLPIADKCQLGSVCSFWRDTISTRQSFWSDIDMMHRPGPLAAILPRSGQSALRVTLTVSSLTDWYRAEELLRPHSHRLQRLHVRFDNMDFYSYSTPWSLLDYPAPSLCEITLDWKGLSCNPRVYSIPQDFCSGVAPQLRAITLRDVGLPPACPALSNVSCAWIEGSHMLGVERVFTVLPFLRSLDLVDVPSYACLPAIPLNHPIAEVRFRNFEASIELLQEYGYLRLRKLVVARTDKLAHLGAASRALSTTSDSSLVIGAAGATALILRSDGGREAIFAADALSLPEIRDALRDGVRDGLFRDVAHLVLPLYPDAGTTGRCPLLQGAIELPRLMSLQIRCGRPTGCSLLDPDVRRGVIFAPLLARLEMIADSDFKPTKICASHLAHFIETTLELGDASALELVIDTAHGMLLESASDLEDQMAYLRSCVGALHM